MSTQIETFYHQRRKYRGAHVFGLVVFVIAWIARSVYIIADLQIEMLHLTVFIMLLVSAVFLGYYAIRFNIIERQIRRNPSLDEALHDELYRFNELKAWKSAFLVVISFIALTAVISIFIEINDIMSVFITALLIGFGTYSTTLYLLDR